MLYGGHVRKIDDIDWLKNHGLDFGEVVIKDSQSCDYWKSRKTACLRDQNFFLIAHGPHEGNPNSVENLEKNYLPTLRQTVLTLSQLGISFLTTHLWMDSRYVLDDVIEFKIEALDGLRKLGEEYGVTVSLENLSESTVDFRRVISRIPPLSLTLDVGHGQLLTQENRAFEIIRDFSRNVGHVHIHDNMGGTGVKDDLHLPLGKGIVDFDRIFTELIRSGYDGTITLELKPEELEESLAYAKSMINEINVRQQFHSDGQPSK